MIKVNFPDEGQCLELEVRTGQDTGKEALPPAPPPPENMAGTKTRQQGGRGKKKKILGWLAENLFSESGATQARSHP